MSGFNEILCAMVERVPGAIGAVFVAWDGEPVGACAREMEVLDLEILGAQWLVVWCEIARAFGRARLGSPSELWLEAERARVMIHAVTEQYCVVLAVRPDAHLATVRRALEEGVTGLRAEMG